MSTELDKYELANEIQRLTVEQKELLEKSGVEQTSALIQNPETGIWKPMDNTTIALTLIEEGVPITELQEIYTGLIGSIKNVREAQASGNLDQLFSDPHWFNGSPLENGIIVGPSSGGPLTSGMPKRPCPKCGTEIQYATSMYGERPENGDLGMCIDCGASFRVSIPGPEEDFALVLLTDDEEASLGLSDRAYLNHIRFLIGERRKGRGSGEAD